MSQPEFKGYPVAAQSADSLFFADSLSFSSCSAWKWRRIAVFCLWRCINAADWIGMIFLNDNYVNLSEKKYSRKEHSTALKWLLQIFNNGNEKMCHEYSPFQFILRMLRYTNTMYTTYATYATNTTSTIPVHLRISLVPQGPKKQRQNVGRCNYFLEQLWNLGIE